MVSGKGAAWKQLTNPNNDLSDIISEQGYLNNAHEAAKKADKEKERLKKVGKAKALEGIHSGNKTRYLNFEHSIADAFHRKGGLVEKYAEAQRRLELDPSDSEAVALKANIEREVQRVAKIKDAIIGYNTKLAEGIASGKISKKLNEGYLTNMERINQGGVFFDVDEYGTITIKNEGNIDLDGYGYPDELTLASIADKNNFGVWEADFDLNTHNNELKKQFGNFHEKKDNGTFTTIETEGYNPAYTADVKKKYRDTLGQDVNSLTNKGKSYLYQLGLTPKQVRENPELYEKVINDLESGFRSLYKTKEFETTNHASKNMQSRNALAWGKFNQKNKPKNSLRTTVDGILAGDSRYLKLLKDQKLEEQGSNGKDIYIREVEYSNGKVVMRLSDETIKEIDPKNREEAISEILKHVRPNDKPDLREEEYRKGEVEVEYQKGDLEKTGNILKKHIEDSLGEANESGKTTSILKDLGIKGVKDKGGLFRNHVSINGKLFKNINDTEGMKALKKYLIENWDELKKTAPKEKSTNPLSPKPPKPFN
ncbi:hypothetical protein [Tenacibaculum sp. 190524A02b]|uniref:hypothetical protein n=1 Tax=Tenacibaculum vairaonense TaxID=3137860 RepID=UPI0031FACBD7